MGKGADQKLEFNGSVNFRRIPVKIGSKSIFNHTLGLSETLDSLVDPFLILDKTGQLLYYNKAAASAFLGSSSQEMLGKNPGEIFFHINPQLVQKFNEAVMQKTPVHFEVELQNTWYDVHYYPSQDQLSVQFHDISKNKHLESELQQSLERFRASVDNMLDSFVILSAIRDSDGIINDFKIEFVNRAACSKIRKTPEEVYGRTLLEIYSGHRNSDLFNSYIRVVETGTPLFRESVIYQDRYFSGFFDVQAVRMRDGIAVSWRDVTQRQMAAEALRLSEERFYKAFHLNPATMSIARVSDGSYIDVNRRWTEATGYTAAEVIGKNPSELSLWVIDGFCRDFRTVFGNQGEVHGLEGQVRTKSGQIITGLLSAEVINMNGEPCWLTVFQDTTEKKLLEEHLARLDRLYLIGETAASIGHEIRNPLTSVRGFLQLISETEAGRHFQEYFSIILEELDRANAIMSEFLLLAKDKAINPQPQNLNTIIKFLYPLLKADASHAEKDIELRLEPLPVANLDDKEIRQLIINLARNGLEAMDPGGTLIISTYYHDGKIVLSIKDTGKGIATELIDKLGTPFVTSKDGGTGLGLAVCYSIAARHQASLTFETGQEGTTFYVKFRPAGSDTWDKGREWSNPHLA